MIIGKGFSGKTWIIDTLCKAMGSISSELKVAGKEDEIYKAINKFVVNPKSMSIEGLYGYVNLLTNEWNDGIIGKLVKDSVENEGLGEMDWIVFDGPVDALWVENLNTVFDDNKMLCLANG